MVQKAGPGPCVRRGGPWAKCVQGTTGGLRGRLTIGAEHRLQSKHDDAHGLAQHRRLQVLLRPILGARSRTGVVLACARQSLLQLQPVQVVPLSVGGDDHLDKVGQVVLVLWVGGPNGPRHPALG
eukprot:CAMPEP_0196661660 /NCGR_PEP_ID=MMETSP1086-20130531/45371_1 /TAXON_ID=77921 /ORGANISM="Cyanoptyche  gloeocystis , Strain SAG4.97" /LENGTH=124 /DNA_ID=CAMNT_0041996663 /DNA_START=96 /DNA_END=466 /DNA_ORIENTATION=+